MWEIYEDLEDEAEAVRLARQKVDLALAKQRLRRQAIEDRAAQIAAGALTDEPSPAPSPPIESPAQRRKRLARDAPINRLIAHLDASEGMPGVGHAGRRRKPPID